MREVDIRNTLRDYMLIEHSGQSGTLVVDELGLCQNAARIDMAAVNGRLHGYEIKSAQDTLERLPTQVDVYNRTFDTLTLVLTGKHKTRGRLVIPRWWGIIEAIETCEGVELRRRRKARQNKHVDPASVVQLLWRKEALRILNERALDRGMRSKPKHLLWQSLVTHLPQDELLHEVRRQIKLRGDWRFGSSQRSGAGSSRRPAKSLHSQDPLVLLRIGQ